MVVKKYPNVAGVHTLFLSKPMETIEMVNDCILSNPFTPPAIPAEDRFLDLYLLRVVRLPISRQHLMLLRP